MSPFGRLSILLTAQLLLGVVCGVTGQLTWVKLAEGVVGGSDVNASAAPAPAGGPAPPGRGDAVLSYDVTRDQLVLFGGRPGPLGDTWIYNLTTKTWREVSAQGPPARYGAVGGVSGNFFYVATGRGLNNTFLRDIWRFNLITEQWNMMQPAIINDQPYAVTKRYYASGGISINGTRFYVSMGSDDDKRSESTFTYDVTDNVWYKEDTGCPNQYDPRCPHPRYLQSGVMVDREEFIIFSGCLSGQWFAGPCPSHDAWHYDGQQKKWRQMDVCPVPRLYSSMALLPGDGSGKRYVLVYGGQTEYGKVVIQTESLRDDEVAVLDVDSGTWTRRRTVPEGNIEAVPLPRMAAAMATGTNGVYLFGGLVRQAIFTNDLWVLLGNATDVERSDSLPCAKITSTYILVHGILMVIGFGFFFPAGALLMRYFHLLYVHIICQILGLCCSITAFALAIASVQESSHSNTHFSFVHAIVGITTMGLVVLQPLNSLLNPTTWHRLQDRETVCKVIWRFIHRFGGRSGILLGLANMTLGIFLAVSILPIVIAWHVWLGFLLLLVVVGEFLRNLFRLRRNGVRKGSSHSSENIINGWEKSDYVNSSTESVRL